MTGIMPTEKPPYHPGDRILCFAIGIAVANPDVTLRQAVRETTCEVSVR